MKPSMNPPSPLPVTRSKQQARSYYSHISRFYDLLSSNAEERFRSDAIRRLQIQPGERILEIGIGTGHGLHRIAKSVGATGLAFGIDIADGMLIAARKKFSQNGIPIRIGLACADGARLPFRAGSFNAAFMSFTLELIDTPEIPVVLAECRRVLSSRGRLSVVSMALSADPNWMSILYSTFHTLFPVWVDCRPIEARPAVEAAGFKVVDASRESMFSLPVDIIIARS